jgi:hypothetical protein
VADTLHDPCTTEHSDTSIWCRDCKRETNHAILRCIMRHYADADPDTGFEGWHEYQIAKCRGCDTLCFRSVTKDSETYDSEYGVIETIHVFPEPSNARHPIDDYMTLPINLRRIYLETVNSLNLKHPVLAGIGIRAIIETVVKDQQATGKVLQEKIDSLVTTGVLTKSGASILHELRILGNKAAHEVKAHSSKQLLLALDVVENLLKAVYILPDQVKETFK